MASITSSRKSIIDSIRENVVGTHSTTDVTTLFDLVTNTTSPLLASQDLAAYIAASEDPDYARSDVSTQILSIASDLPFAHAQTAQLVEHLSAADPAFRSQLSQAIGDLVASESGSLRDAPEGTGDPAAAAAAGYVALHGFLARLLALGLHDGAQRITGLDDALFIIVEGLEREHPLGPDVAAAAQYFVHASDAVRWACMRHEGLDKAGTSPLWSSGGPLWKGPAGYGEERWDQWRRRLATLESDSSSDGGTRKAARLAARAMDACSAS